MSKPARTTTSRPIYLSSTQARNQFERVLDQAVRDATVVITRRDVPKAVMLSVERYEALTRTSLYLGALTREFDALVASMQTSGARAAARDLFSATSEDLGRAAVGAALRTS